jgi:hypothetical protein
MVGRGPFSGHFSLPSSSTPQGVPLSFFSFFLSEDYYFCFFDIDGKSMTTTKGV